ncbi:hypothetical protein CBL_13807 [Carabus blaptoides fortunei]
MGVGIGQKGVWLRGTEKVGGSGSAGDRIVNSNDTVSVTVAESHQLQLQFPMERRFPHVESNDAPRWTKGQCAYNSCRFDIDFVVIVYAHDGGTASMTQRASPGHNLRNTNKSTNGQMGTIYESTKDATLLIKRASACLPGRRFTYAD